LVTLVVKLSQLIHIIRSETSQVISHIILGLTLNSISRSSTAYSSACQRALLPGHSLPSGSNHL
jgi:hypothetical protein